MVKEKYNIMINIDLLDRVRYPDQNDGWYLDTEPYDKIVEYLKHSIQISDGENKKYYQENLTELEHRWEERQAKAKRIDISAKKVTV